MSKLKPPRALEAALAMRAFLLEQGIRVPLPVAQEALARTRGAACYQDLLLDEHNSMEEGEALDAAAQAGRARETKRPKEAKPTLTTVQFNMTVQVLDQKRMDERLDERGFNPKKMSLEGKLSKLCVDNPGHPFLQSGQPTVVIDSRRPGPTPSVVTAVVSCQVDDVLEMCKVAEIANQRYGTFPLSQPHVPGQCLRVLLCQRLAQAGTQQFGYEYLGFEYLPPVKAK